MVASIFCGGNVEDFMERLVLFAGYTIIVV